MRREINVEVAELLRKGLNPIGDEQRESDRVVAKHLPLIKARPLPPADTPSLTAQQWCDWLKDLEQQQEVERYEKAFGHQYVARAHG